MNGSLRKRPQHFISDINQEPNTMQSIQNDNVKVEDNWKPCLTVTEGGCIHDFCWHPLMNSNMGTCCNFLTTSAYQPVHMWDAFNGQLVSSFLVRNNTGGVDNIVSVSYNGKLSGGSKIYCGLDKRICVFDTERGSCSSFTEVYAVEKSMVKGSNSKTRSRSYGQTGLISCFAFNPQEESIYAAGCYNNTVGIYDQNQQELQFLIECEYGTGVNQIQFSSNGTYLFQSSRKDERIVCWDLRNLFEPVKYFEFSRKVSTNQKVNFDMDTLTQYAIAGTEDGKCCIFDLNQNGKPITTVDMETENMINSISMHPFLPYFAVSTGERKYHLDVCLDEDSSSDEEEPTPGKGVKRPTPFDVTKTNHVALWRIPDYEYRTLNQ